GRLAGAGNAGEHGDGTTFAERVDGGALFRREVDARRLDGASQRCNRQGPGTIADVLLGELGELLLDADLRGLADADLLLEEADHQGDVLIGDADATALQQLDHPPDVVGPAGNAGADQPAGGVHAESVVIDDGRGAELLGEVAGGEVVGDLVAVVVAQPFVRDPGKHRVVAPAQCRRLLAPQPPLVRLHLAQPPLSAGVAKNVHLRFGAETVPVETLARRELLRARFREFLHVQRADPAVRLDDDVHQEVVDVHVRVAGDLRLARIGRAVPAVLDVGGRPRRVMAEADPADGTLFGAVPAAASLARPAEDRAGVAHGAVGGAVDAGPQQRAFGRAACELCGEADRFVRAEDQVEAAQGALVLRPALTRVRPPRLEQARHLLVSRRAPRVDADCTRDDGGHVGPPGGAAVAAGVVGGQPPALLELAPALVHR